MIKKYCGDANPGAPCCKAFGQCRYCESSAKDKRIKQLEVAINAAIDLLNSGSPSLGCIASELLSALEETQDNG